jgi:hypothetical protein
LKDDPATAIKGVLWRARGAWLVLVHAELLKAASAPTPVDGDVVVHRSNVAFLQVIP